MSLTQSYPLNQAIGVRLLEHGSECYPFNLQFYDTSRAAGIPAKELSGPGIYTIAFQGQLIYLGKYQPFERGNILNDCWIRHVETLTLRGNRLGFNGAKNPESKLKQLLGVVQSGTLA